ncbi:MAG TPA: cation diffusion facilitator family transporter [Bacteroidales bacterium]|nr:cation diffusion facilitator family transporter [Bacteroidales bacterium]HNS47219.1 cation diffusion facilitator family transporter [Bacteroidales bacterium]
MTDRTHLIIRTSWIGIIGNSLLSVMKIVLGFISGSLAVVGDGIDSAGDIIISWITLFTARFISRPPDTTYAYGYAKADTLATLVLAFVIFFAGAQLAISSVTQLFKGEYPAIPSLLAIYVTVISIAGKLILSLIHFRTGRQINSAMLIANGKNMQNDMIISLGVLIGLFFTRIYDLPVIDKIIALVISVWIMRVGLQIFMRTNIELMDGIKDPAVYDQIVKAVGRVPKAQNPHRMRVHQIGNSYMITCDIEVDGTITVDESHEIAKNVEESIKANIGNVYDVMVHVEPAGNIEREVYGVSDHDVKKINPGK